MAERSEFAVAVALFLAIELIFLLNSISIRLLILIPGVLLVISDDDTAEACEILALNCELFGQNAFS